MLKITNCPEIILSGNYFFCRIGNNHVFCISCHSYYQMAKYKFIDFNFRHDFEWNNKNAALITFSLQVLFLKWEIYHSKGNIFCRIYENMRFSMTISWNYCQKCISCISLNPRWRYVSNFKILYFFFIGPMKNISLFYKQDGSELKEKFLFSSV